MHEHGGHVHVNAFVTVTLQGALHLASAWCWQARSPSLSGSKAHVHVSILGCTSLSFR
jgi:hypothetical protein